MSLKPYLYFVPSKIETEEDLIENLWKLGRACGIEAIKALRQWNRGLREDNLEVIHLEDKIVNVQELTEKIRYWDFRRDSERRACYTCRNQVREIIFEDESDYRCSKGVDKRKLSPHDGCPKYSAIIQKRNGEPARSLEEILTEVEEKLKKSLLDS